MMSADKLSACWAEPLTGNGSDASVQLVSKFITNYDDIFGDLIKDASMIDEISVVGHRSSITPTLYRSNSGMQRSVGKVSKQPSLGPRSSLGTISELPRQAMNHVARSLSVSMRSKPLLFTRSSDDMSSDLSSSRSQSRASISSASKISRKPVQYDSAEEEDEENPIDNSEITPHSSTSPSFKRTPAGGIRVPKAASEVVAARRTVSMPVSSEVVRATMEKLLETNRVDLDIEVR
jgi:hypothetical protein